MNPILLDTHAALWSASGTISASAARLIDAAAERGDLLLSPITAWEIAMLVEKRRLLLAPTVQEYIRALFGQPGVATATLTPAIAAGAAALPGKFHADPADRILVATAAAYGARFVTRDKRIREYAKATNYLRCIGC
ncbi:MAG TPA: type II toxin-antitoxin system VapC family toxin [Candidatus Baltobacteraceae bacterium]|jgi:PIN domain nuclease of toxin-antitoxin system|nr:type II toxin-antitoxin system VapC family toxin [Candidatus Baltobacteraceae bacterium]